MPKLYLRDAFAFVVLVGLVLGWYLDHRDMLRSQNRLRLEAEILSNQLSLVLFETRAGGTNIKIDNEAGVMTVTYPGNKTVSQFIVALPRERAQSAQSAFRDYDAVLFTLPAHVLLLDAAILSAALSFGWSVDRWRLVKKCVALSRQIEGMPVPGGRKSR